MLVPRFVAEPIGLMHVAGGRGLSVSAEIDTIVSDAALVLLLIHLAQERWRGPLLSWHLPLVQLALTSTMLAAALAYVVSNFGTLMRHRGMLLTSICGMLLLIGRAASDAQKRW